MRPSGSTLLLWLILALLLFLVWLTVTGRLGDSRHGYAAVQRRQAARQSIMTAGEWAFPENCCTTMIRQVVHLVSGRGSDG